MSAPVVPVVTLPLAPPLAPFCCCFRPVRDVVRRSHNSRHTPGDGCDRRGRIGVCSHASHPWTNMPSASGWIFRLFGVPYAPDPTARSFLDRAAAREDDHCRVEAAVLDD